MKLEEIDKNGTLQGFVLVRTCERKSAKNGSSYLDLVITDGEEDVVAKIWDFRGTAAEQPAAGEVIRVRGTLSRYNNQLQFKIDRFRAVNDADKVDISDFVPTAAFSGESMLNEIFALVNDFKDEQLKKLACAVLEEYKNRILELPAAFKLHHAVRYGLLLHTLSLCRLAQAVCSLYSSIDRDLLICGAVLHDIAKSEEFSLAPSGLVDGYTVEGTLIGHLVMGAMRVDEIGKKIGVDDNTRMLVEHMIISHHGNPEFGAAVRPLFIEAEVLSRIDTLDAAIYEMEDAVRGVEPGGFTNRLWALDDRKFYNHGRKEIVTDAAVMP